MCHAVEGLSRLGKRQIYTTTALAGGWQGSGVQRLHGFSKVERPLTAVRLSEGHHVSFAPRTPTRPRPERWWCISAVSRTGDNTFSEPMYIVPLEALVAL